jgi:8-oxo-dGTP pyrophosphatase MutT (NUDIX family)
VPEQRHAAPPPARGPKQPEPIPRPAARVVLLDPAGRIFLFCYVSPETGHRYWITPGGGLDPGESHLHGARRELAEETGLTEVAIGPCLWTRDHVIDWLGERFLMQERFFLARTDGTEIDVSGFDAFERQVLPECRWWSLPELRTAERTFGPHEAFQPPGLIELLAPVLAGRIPAEPIALPA